MFEKWKGHGTCNSLQIIRDLRAHHKRTRDSNYTDKVYICGDNNNTDDVDDDVTPPIPKRRRICSDGLRRPSIHAWRYTEPNVAATTPNAKASITPRDHGIPCGDGELLPVSGLVSDATYTDTDTNTFTDSDAAVDALCAILDTVPGCGVVESTKKVTSATDAGNLMQLPDLLGDTMFDSSPFP
jgi:hypothetical protein